MYLCIGLFTAALLFGVLIRRATAPRYQNIGISGPAPARDSAPEI